MFITSSHDEGHKEVCRQMRNQILGLQKFVENNKTVLIFRRFRSDVQNVFARKINKIALSANDDKRIQTCISFRYRPNKSVQRKID